MPGMTKRALALVWISKYPERADRLHLSAMGHSQKLFLRQRTLQADGIHKLSVARQPRASLATEVLGCYSILYAVSRLVFPLYHLHRSDCWNVFYLPYSSLYSNRELAYN